MQVHKKSDTNRKTPPRAGEPQGQENQNSPGRRRSSPIAAEAHHKNTHSHTKLQTTPPAPLGFSPLKKFLRPLTAGTRRVTLSRGSKEKSHQGRVGAAKTPKSQERVGAVPSLLPLIAEQHAESPQSRGKAKNFSDGTRHAYTA